jgi:trehalose 6-phosphate phosphatase
MLDPKHDHFVRTVEVVEKALRLGPTVYRYRYDDGLPGPEGGFHLCTSWLIQSYLAVGRVDDARDLFAQMIALAGPTGLLSEQYGPRTKRSLGNHPQAFSHLGLIEAAAALSKA